MTILEKATEALQKHFGFGSLRDFQTQAISAWAEGKDVLIALSTGAGKSLCFQLPPVALGRSALTLVISPLISLMQDQLRTLRLRQIPVSCCGAGESTQLAEAFEAARGGVVYMSPEYALARLPQLKKLKDWVCLLAIDEAHCISAWGHDFRKSYKDLGRLREILGMPPTMALTATCTDEVQKDIRDVLQLSDHTVLVKGSINRPNLKFVVQPRSALEKDFSIFDLQCPAEERLVDNTSVNPMSSTIVYVVTRARSEEVASWLQKKGVKAAAYHAGLAVHQREKLHRLFMLDQLQVIVATVAFGMGIDKPSIRRVVHYGGVQSMAHFLQQCGRAGRDGEEAECLTFFRPADEQEMRNVMLQTESSQDYQQRQFKLLNEMTQYLADSLLCRRVGLLRHFGEEPRAIEGPGSAPRKGECVRIGKGLAFCQWCDVCLKPTRGSVLEMPESDFTAECFILLDCVLACDGKTGRNLVLAVAVGSNSQQVRSFKLHQHRHFGKGQSKSLSWWKAFLPHVLRRGLLQEKPARLASGRSYAAISLSEAGKSMVQTRCGSFVMSPVPEELRQVKAPTLVAISSGVTGGQPSAAEEKVHMLYKRLSHVRQQHMRRLNIMGETIISNPLLRSLAQHQPCSVAQAQQNVPGLPHTLQPELQELLEALVQEINSCNGKAVDASAPKRKLPWDDTEHVIKVRSSVVPSIERSETKKEVSDQAPPDDWLDLLEM